MSDSPQSAVPSPGPRRVSSLGWVGVFLAMGGLVFLVWTQFQKIEVRSAALLPIYRGVPPFTAINQDGESVRSSDLQGKIWIASFFFTDCKGPCPLVMARMREVQLALQKSIPAEMVQLVSISVEPEKDTPEVLKNYAGQLQADPTRWSFLHAPREQMEELVIRGLLQPLASEPDGTPAHSTKVVVIDPQGQIRSFQEGVDPNVVANILLDVGSLLGDFFPQTQQSARSLSHSYNNP